MPAFSIIIPIYNVAHPSSDRYRGSLRSGDIYLRECLGSVLAAAKTLCRLKK